VSAKALSKIIFMGKKREQLNAELKKLEEKYGDCQLLAIPKVGIDLVGWLRA